MNRWTLALITALLLISSAGTVSAVRACHINETDDHYLLGFKYNSEFEEYSTKLLQFRLDEDVIAADKLRDGYMANDDVTVFENGEEVYIVGDYNPHSMDSEMWVRRPGETESWRIYNDLVMACVI